MEQEKYEVHPEIAKEMPGAVVEEKKYDVHPMIAAEMAQEEQAPEPVVEQSQQKLQEQQKANEETYQARNFREIKAQKEQIERERDELLKYFKQQQNQHQQPKPQEEDYQVADDTIIEGKHLNRYKKEINNLRNEIKQYQDQTSLQSTRLQLKTDFPDFDKVVTPENISRFKDEYPELARTLDAAQDPYAAGASAYTLFKKFGIAIEDNYEAERYKVKENIAKPKPVTSVSSQQGSSPLAKANAFANGLTDELRKQLVKEMAEARKSL